MSKLTILGIDNRKERLIQLYYSITYNMPVVPVVFSAVSLDNVTGQTNASQVASAYGPWNYVLDLNGTVDIVVNNSDAGKHPL